MAKSNGRPRPKLVNAPPSTNGHATNGVPGGPRMLTANEAQWRRYESLITNLTTMRRDWLQNLLDPRRDVNKECGYPTGQVSAQVYQDLFDREPISNRVVTILPRETWQVQPLLYEDESPDVVTPFEKAWDDLARQLRGGSMYQDEAGNPVWEYLLRADVLSGIGQFAVILLGIDDGLRLDQPAEGVTDGRDEPKAKDKKPDRSSNQGLTLAKPETSSSPFGVSPYGSFQDTLYSQTSLAPPRSKNTTDGPDLDFSEGAGEPSETTEPIRSDATREKNDPSVEPLPPEGGEDESASKRRLLFIRVFAENLVQISRWNADPASPRFGFPDMYRITLADPTKSSTGIGQPSMTVDVHWTRVIHVADNLASSEVLGVPRMQPVLNRLLDVQKISGAAGEGYWKQAFSTLVLESNPQLGGDVDIDRSALRDDLENLDGGLQKSLVLMGMQAKTLPPGITDPTPFLNAMIEQICVQIGVPVRVFKGSERGELASSQDDAAWNDRLRARQTYYVTPRIVIPFVDRLIAMGVLPKPKTGKKSVSELGAGKRGLDAQAKPAPGAPAPGEEGGDEGGPPKPGGKPSFPPFSKQRAAGGPPKFNALPFEIPEEDDDELGEENGVRDGAEGADAFGAEDDLLAEGGASEVAIDAGEGKTNTPGYSIEWPDIDSMTDLERAQVFNQRVAAWAAYVQGGVDQLIPPEFAMTHLDQFDDEEAMAILAEGIKRQEETLAREAEQMKEFGFEPDPSNPGGMIDPDQQEAENEIEMAKAKNPAGVQGSGPPSPFGAKPGGPPGTGGPPQKKPPFVKNETTDNVFCPTGEGGGVDPSCSKDNAGDVPEGHTRLFRVEPTITGPKADDSHWLKKHLSPAQFQQFLDEQGGLFTPQLHKLEQYGHGSSGYTTYFVDVPTAEADKYKRTHAEGDWDEYPLPKNMRESKKIYQRKE